MDSTLLLVAVGADLIITTFRDRVCKYDAKTGERLRLPTGRGTLTTRLCARLRDAASRIGRLREVLVCGAPEPDCWKDGCRVKVLALH